MKRARDCSPYELFEPRMKGLPPEIREYLTPSIKAGFEAAEEIQEMQNHWIYRFGESICVNGEVLYMMGQGVKKAWRAVTFRT